MKLLLIQPYSHSDFFDQINLFEPLALEYLGASAKLDGHTVLLLDARIDRDIAGVVTDFAPDIVGLTGFTCHLNIIKEISIRIKRILPTAKIIVGGHHATVRPEDFNSPDIDIVAVGEGVITLREVMESLANSRDLQKISGLGIPSPDGMTFTPSRPYPSLDALPVPDRSLTEAYRTLYFCDMYKPMASIRTSLGCVGRCSFCALWSITGGKYLRRNPENIVSELAGIAEENVFFCDDESMCDAKRMNHLAELIASAGIRKKYILYARADSITRHPELFARWAAIGLSRVIVGMEDCSDARLAAMNKRITNIQQQEAAVILKRLGVALSASFMVNPDYGTEDFSALREYVLKLQLTHSTFTVMTPLPGTRLYDAAGDAVKAARPEMFDLLHALMPTRLPLEEFYKELTALYTETVALPGSFNHLKWFRMLRQM